MAKVLVIGSGGREHALCYKFKLSPKVEEVYVAPGNCGMKNVATLVDIASDNFSELVSFVKEKHIDLTFVGPEIPLAEGIVDYFEQAGLRIFGPSKKAAVLEGSKVFAKNMMKKYHIPTATYETFNDYEKAIAYIDKTNYKVVIKADGLAYGKGVIIPSTKSEAKEAIKEMMCNELFGKAGHNLVIEEFLEGEEFSLLAFVKNDLVYPMQIAQDHKRSNDGDTGLNTGGMGAYTPVTHISNEVVIEAINKVMTPMAKAMVSEGCPFVGILYGGMMLTQDGIKTIEFNVRFGDPETEVILQALSSDLYDIVSDVLDGREPVITFDSKTYCGVVMAANGYPENYEKGAIITNLETENALIFHMGTKEINSNICINGGRVLLVSGSGNNMEEARNNAYSAIKNIKCENLYYRSDIGHHALKNKS